MMNGKCACEGKNLDRFLQPVILHILSKRAETGYSIVQRTARYTTFRDSSPDPTGVYRYLKTLLERGLIALEEEKDQTHSGARYVLTAGGENCLRAWRDTLAQYADTIRTLSQELADAQ